MITGMQPIRMNPIPFVLEGFATGVLFERAVIKREQQQKELEAKVNDYLFNLSQSMEKGDYLIIGNGIRVGERLVSLDTYKHDAWNDWFIHLAKGLGLSPEDLEFDARFGNKRVEMFYRVKTDKNINIDGKSAEIKSGDEILVGILYKYYVEELEKFCKMYFEQVELVKDQDSEYALVICRK